MFKIGDKVKIVKLDEQDKIETNLEIGDIGTVEYVYDDQDIAVKFNNIVCDRFSQNFKYGLYDMYNYQVELIEEDLRDIIKDEMIVTFRNGQKGICINGRIYLDALKRFEISIYTKKLINIFDGRRDIMKIEHMNETIWERKERKLVTFDEARKSGKKVRCYEHKEFQVLNDLLIDICKTIHYNDLNEFLDNKHWEVEE